jgi:glucose-6-phosphate 1-dehydrogenase
MKEQIKKDRSTRSGKKSNDESFIIDKPFVFTIFGASGDLAKEKLFPALYTLMHQDRFPNDFYIWGYSRTKKTHKQFREEVRKSVTEKTKNIDGKKLNRMLGKTYYFSGQYNKNRDYQRFFIEIEDICKGKTFRNIAHLSVPPQVFKPIIENISTGKDILGQDLSLIIEKPFGEDEESARELFHFVSRFFEEKHIYLLDHYLGKESIQSILRLRYLNSVLNLLLQGKEIANIQITAFEDMGITDRAGYFDQVGIIKDMIQSHLLQILAYLTMSLPVVSSHENLQREKNSVLSALNFPMRANNIVLGQYKSYHQEKDVQPGTKTETFAAIRFFIDKLSWYQVPIYIRTGKMLKKKVTSFVIEFKKLAFQKKHSEVEPNRLIIELQPESKIQIKLVNQQGIEEQYIPVTAEQSLACPEGDCLPEHAHLLIDVFQGEKEHFLSFPEIIAAWKFTDKVLKVAKEHSSIHSYSDKSYGPKQQFELTAIDNFTWYEL